MLFLSFLESRKTVEKLLFLVRRNKNNNVKKKKLKKKKFNGIQIGSEAFGLSTHIFWLVLLHPFLSLSRKISYFVVFVAFNVSSIIKCFA